MYRLLAIIVPIVILIITACDTDGQQIDPATDLATAQAGVLSANVAIQKATVNAAGTAQAETRGAMATEAAWSLSQRQAAASVTAEAVHAQATANALAIAATSDAIVERQKMEKLSAQATISATTILQTNLLADSQRGQQTASFYDSAGKFAVISFGLMGLAGAFLLTTKGIELWFSTAYMRRSVVETRQGTMVIDYHEDNGYSHRLLSQPAEPAKKPPVTVDSFIINSNGRSQVVSKEEPPEDPQRKLVLKLLRDSAKINGENGWQSDLIPSASVLGWPHATRSKAVKLVRPLLEIREGRGGSTRLKDRSLYDLYGDIGERRLTLPVLP